MEEEEKQVEEKEPEEAPEETGGEEEEKEPEEAPEETGGEEKKNRLTKRALLISRRKAARQRKKSL